MFTWNFICIRFSEMNNTQILVTANRQTAKNGDLTTQYINRNISCDPNIISQCIPYSFIYSLCKYIILFNQYLRDLYIINQTMRLLPNRSTDLIIYIFYT